MVRTLRIYRHRPSRVIAAGVAVATLAGGTLAMTGRAAAGPGAGGAAYQATIVRTTYGIPHITARGFGSLGYGYGYALASDDMCMMADSYLTVEGQRSRYFGPNGSAPVTQVSNLDSDLLWRWVIGRRVIPRLLSVRSGPGAVGPQLRQLISGYVAGYNRYLASVGGPAGVPDSSCRGKPWVKPITALDEYLLIYQADDGGASNYGQANDPAAIATAQPPPASMPNTARLPTMRQLRELAGRLHARRGSNAIAVGSAGTRDHQHGMLLGNPHSPWVAPDRFYQVQLTIPGTMNVEGATLAGIPLVVIGFTATMAWSETSSTAYTVTPYQLTLVPGHPAEYVFDGRPVAMTSRTVTVAERHANGTVTPFRQTLWSSRYGPMISEFKGMSLPWTTKSAFTLADANAGNLRILGSLLATDEARSTAAELTALDRYQALPEQNTTAVDAGGHALYSSVMAVPHVTNAEAKRCDTAIGAVSFREAGLPVLDGSRPSCAWGTDPDSATPGIFGPREEPSLVRRDFVENSNSSYWLTNPAHPLTGYPRIIGDYGAPWGASPRDFEYDLRTRSALAMIIGRIRGTDGLGPPGFTFGDMKNLMYSDVQYGATLVKAQLVKMCRSFPGGRAPTSTGTTIPVGDSCHVLAAWNGTEDPSSRGALLFQTFWCPFEITSKSRGALCGPSPWAHPFQAADPLRTPYGLNTASTQVQRAFGSALAAMKAAHLPYDAALGAVQYLIRNGKRIPLPGGPADPYGEFNAIYQSAPGEIPSNGSTYIQVVTWKAGDPCPQAATVLTYSESANPSSPHYADQTRLFSRRGWVTARFCPDQVAAHAVSTNVLRSR